MKKLTTKRQYVLIHIVLIIIIIVALFSINSLKRNYKEEVGKSLKTVSAVVQSAYNVWIDHLKNDVEEVAAYPHVVKLTEELLQSPPDSLSLTDCKALLKLREFLNPHLDFQNYVGFFIISVEDYMSYGSMRNSNIGTKNLIVEAHPKLLEKAKNGTFILVPPIISDVKLKIDSALQNELTMFSGAPIKNSKGKVIAILTFRINPSQDFTRISKLGRIGYSGETYAINLNGFMVTESRFDKDLKRIGLIAPDKKSMKNLKITDPGENILTNYQPETVNNNLPLTVAAASVLKKESDINIIGYNDYRGIPVLGSWVWDDEFQLGFITEIDAEEALHPYHKSRNIVLYMLLITIILVLLLTSIIIKSSRINRIKLLKINEQLEDKVKIRTKELQKLNTTKDRFFSIIAHDLKSPFNYLLGMTRVLPNVINTMNPDKLKILILKLHDSAQSAFDLLENLLIWARTQQKLIKILQKAHDLKGIVNYSVEPLLNLALNKNINLTNEITLDDKIFVDEYMISTVIRNLVSNAIKFTRNNGAIKIYAERKENEIVISVNDKGVGMSQEIISKLFIIGENISTSGTNNETGTGLGLILCQEFVTKNGGKIWAESQEGVGTTFYFTVPISK
jgi:signal transduction histidine kinase